jgi:hypothetical protein
MALLLKTVAPSQGARWMRDGFRLFGRHPLAFSLMLVSFLFAALLVSMVPLLGPLVMLAGLPLMSLGFMVAAESALRGGPIHPGHFGARPTDGGRCWACAWLTVRPAWRRCC